MIPLRSISLKHWNRTVNNRRSKERKTKRSSKILIIAKSEIMYRDLERMQKLEYSQIFTVS
jgi:hypothetical protein